MNDELSQFARCDSGRPVIRADVGRPVDFVSSPSVRPSESAAVCGTVAADEPAEAALTHAVSELRIADLAK